VTATGHDGAERVGVTSQAQSAFPHYDHLFLLIAENHNFSQIIGNPSAPIINALASDYGLATGYTGTSDPSEPNYVAMLGGSDFGIASDDPYFFPGHTVDAENLMSQLDAAGKTWKGYFQNMPYAGFRGYCFPGKCNGIPDSDTQYVAKHNGIVNFANMQNPAGFGKQGPLAQLAADLASGDVPNLGYIVGDECDDMHGAPPWCVDSGNPGDVDDIYLVARGDAFVGRIVDMIRSSAMWTKGNNAIVVTFDEGDTPQDLLSTIVITSHGPRGITDPTPYNHFSLLASLQQTFGLGCLLNSCTAAPMAPLFAITGANANPPLPAPFVPAPNGDDTPSATGPAVKGSPFKLPTSGWTVVPSPSLDDFDNSLASVSAGSANDVWAVGTYQTVASGGNIIAPLGAHFDGKRWSAFALPNVGLNENALLSVSTLPSGEAWAVGYFADSHYRQRTLIQHFDGSTWTVVPSPNPGAKQNLFYGVVALSGCDSWAVGGSQDANDLWHTLAAHWDGHAWKVVPTADPGATGNVLYAVAASSSGVFATGQRADHSFPGIALVERWDGDSWDVVSTPTDPGGTDISLGATADGSDLTIVGDRESSTAPYTTFVAEGNRRGLSIVSTPNSGAGENDLFSATTADDGSTWAVGWLIDPASGNHDTLIEQGRRGTWSLSSSPNPNPANGDNGFSSVSAVPGGGVWAVGVTTNADGSLQTLIAYHP
jgi:hypothetical protein